MQGEAHREVSGRGWEGGLSVSEEAGSQQTPESTEAGDGVRQVTEEAL